MIFLGLGEHAHFANFGMAFLTLFRVATGDNWNGIMKDTLREDCISTADCMQNCCVSHVIAPIYFVIFVLMAQFVLVNVVVAVSIAQDLYYEWELKMPFVGPNETSRRIAQTSGRGAGNGQ